MAFNGSLITINGAEFPWHYVEENSYKCALKTLDLDSGRVATGVLERNVLQHQSIEISFTIKSLTNTEQADLWSFLRSRYISGLQERKLRINAYVPELDDYVIKEVYVASDPTFQIRQISPSKRVIKYASYEMKFIGY